MRRTDDFELDPAIAAQLDAIDATLAGEPVNPEHADIAELALLLAAGRPPIDPGFARSLDERVERRFPGRAPDRRSASAPATARPLQRWWSGSLFGPIAGLSAGVVGVLVAVVLLGSAGGGSSSSNSASTPDFGTQSTPGTSTSAASSGAPTSSAASSSAASSSGSASAGGGPARTLSGAAASRAPSHKSAGGTASSAASNSLAIPPSAALGAPTPASAPRPVPNGRRIIQSAQLALTTRPDRIDYVAQEVFDVVGQENGFVSNSSVTAGGGGYAQFELSVPSSSLQATMTALSQLHYASVASRTDNVQDVNGQYLSDQRRLGDDRALRTSLLKQLAAATTQAQIDSLKARIADAEASIRSDESTLHNLGHRIDYSQVQVSLNGANSPARRHHARGFGLGTAAHDAGRVLTVAAGVALIALAALVPVGLVTALGLWIAAALRRRRREQALDLA